MTYEDVSDSDFALLQYVILDELRAQLAMGRDVEDIPEMIADEIVRVFEVRRKRQDHG